MYVVTTNEVPGRPTEAVLGIVVGAVALTRNKYDAGMKALHDREWIDRDRALIRDRRAAIDQLADEARRVGANAVVGVRFDHREVAAWWSEVCAYGTAVVVRA